MGYQIEEALKDVVKEKGIETEFLVEALEVGLQAALKRKFGTADNAVIEIDTRNCDDLAVAVQRHVARKVRGRIAVCKGHVLVKLHTGRRTCRQARVAAEGALKVHQTRHRVVYIQRRPRAVSQIYHIARYRRRAGPDTRSQQQVLPAARYAADVNVAAAGVQRALIGQRHRAQRHVIVCRRYRARQVCAARTARGR